MQPLGNRRCSAGAERHEQRQQMLVRRMLLHREGRPCPVMQQIVRPLLRYRGVEPVGESHDVGRLRRSIPSRRNRARLCVNDPDPIISTFSSRNAASARPSRTWWAGSSWDWIPTCRTGYSAAGYISDNGTQAPWSSPRSRSIVLGNPASASSAAALSAKAGAPGGSYRIANSSGGNP